MQFYEYKGFIIYPTPQYIISTSCWKVELIIKYNNTVSKYNNDNKLYTKGEAYFHCIQFGKKLIDDGIILLAEAI
jgi:hypothetical protein